MYKRLNFTCPKCNRPLDKQVHAAAHDWSEGIPFVCTVHCSCDEDVEFELSWKLWLARPVMAKELRDDQKRILFKV